ncbi:hypothetical protein [Azospirillum griseum]|uniref:Uncharacterized protein n=1 Tax=Azospirillum griseum TaxID=2496639 RepID=A0A3S0K6L2_9PROT|nr:hypothetical protein [Azospirillum griseum]RTR22429.1 hypothetical protein EJ903_06275 [Azospirillum griseum]
MNIERRFTSRGNPYAKVAKSANFFRGCTPALSFSDADDASAALISAVCSSAFKDVPALVEAIVAWSLNDSRLIRQAFIDLSNLIPTKYIAELGFNPEQAAQLTKKQRANFWHNFAIELTSGQIDNDTESEESEPVYAGGEALFSLPPMDFRTASWIWGLDGNGFRADDNFVYAIYAFGRTAFSRVVGCINQSRKRQIPYPASRPPLTRWQVMTFSLQTGHPPPLSTIDNTHPNQKGELRVDYSTFRGEKDVHRQFCRSATRRPVSDRYVPQSRPGPYRPYSNGPRPHERGHSPAGSALPALSAPHKRCA